MNLHTASLGISLVTTYITRLLTEDSLSANSVLLTAIKWSVRHKMVTEGAIYS